MHDNLAFDLRNGDGSQDDQRSNYMAWYESPENVLFTVGHGNHPSANPLLAAPGSYDFHLRPRSPAGRHGDPRYTLPTDIDGTTRTQASLGAYAVP